MRAVDADKLIVEYCKQNECLQNHSGDCRSCFAKSVIDEAPTITYEDLVPHGRWIVTVSPLTGCKKVTCSECGHRKDRGPAWDISWGLPDWCEGCGAKMDGGNDNGPSA